MTSSPAATHPSQEPIAVVGSACRLAGGSTSPSKLWSLLRSPRDVRSEIPPERFNVTGYYHPNGAQHGHMNVKHAYLLHEDPRVFDAEFFGINPVEASAMDPQQRLLLETVYEAVEAAGMTIEGLKGSNTAVYAGLMCGDYDSLLLRDPDRLPTYTAVGTSRAVLSNRISYFFDWHGPSLTTDTACSSSLVAVHQAMHTLRAGDARAAVACGSNLILGPEMFIIESKVKMLSPDGISRMWDKNANGYARGDGVAAVMLKTLSQALADGDDIECIIRETGINQDGATGGLTMPSASAQRELIRSVYAKAGLDPQNNPAHRPQYIEAHGTGTPAGDPVEAEALSSAFFRHGEDAHEHPIYTGSVKTVLGHTEGTAGIAGLLKASLAMRHSTIPPNLHFSELAPNVAPFYGNLQIATAARPWPKTPGEQPRRASVNNFGFGGTNVHAILESYDAPAIRPSDDTQITPLVFSAASEEGLRANLAAYSEYLAAHPGVNMRDLAYTLRERRSVFAHRTCFAGETPEHLASNISSALENTDSPVGTRSWRRTGDACRLLGVFTGQGAQHARMGAALIEKSPLARSIIQALEAHLAELGEDRPSWSLTAELLADTCASRVGEAAISQPLCTAVQIMMVDLLAAANIHFNAVVGHSSGEIAAAYAAGYLSARDALLVAYYRGLHCKHATSPNGAGIKGAMLAAGTSLEDATELCESEELSGRVSIAACNSSSSITFSGDEDAIDELALALEDEKKFSRRLRVDQAYHSRHMLPCSAPYIASLKQAGVQVQKNRGASANCVWFSSVTDGKPMDDSHMSQLGGEYWAKNMTQPVLFATAITSALAGDGTVPFAAAIEVGAHPTLAGPASQTIQEVQASTKLPYFGTLSRNAEATEAFAACLGSLWANLDPVAGIPSLQKCEAALTCSANQQANFHVLKGLPTYQWKHETRHWAESRRSRKLRLRERPFHPLLGDASPDSAPHLLRWKNILKPIEMPWVQGHQVQNQIVLPAAAYVSSAVEAAQFLVEDDKQATIELIELSNFHIHNPIMFDTDDTGVEVHIELSQVSTVRPGCITANFVYSAALGGDNAELDLAAQGEVRLLFGTPSHTLLPSRQPKPPHVIPVDSNRLYGFMASLEYDFSGPFKSLVHLERKLGKASCVAQKARTSPVVPDDADSFLVHPVDLDAAFQSVMLAYSYPGDDQLRLLHLPTSIAKVRVNPTVLRSSEFSDHDLTAVDSTCSASDRASPGAGFSGSVNMYANNSKAHAAVQVEQVQFKPVGSDASNDRNVFYNMHWVLSHPDGALAADQVPISPKDKELMFVLSRIAAFYLRQFDKIVPEDSPLWKQGPECHYLNYARHMTSLLESGKHQWAHQSWVKDTLQDVLDDIALKGYTQSSDVQIMLLVGETMPKVFRGETTMLEHFRESGLLDQYYATGFGTKQTTIWVASVLKQLTDRNPHLSLLEIGAGTGGATQSILNTIGRDFDHYTFTDISSSFFENAAAKFAAWEDRIRFKVCNAEIDPTAQGFEAGTYDVVIAFMVVHACAKLDEAMVNLRKLLKPGGMLILGEGAADGAMQAGAGFIFGTLSGWWRGVDEGRTLSPLVNVSEWEAILKRSGFSGIDTMSPPRLFDAFGITLFVSTAVDARIEFAIDPLAAVAEANEIFQKVVVLGGQTAPVADLARSIMNVLVPLAATVVHYRTLEEMPDGVLDAETRVVSLVDLESPIFKDITPERWYKFRQIFESEKTVLWLTRGRLQDDPYCNMTVGFGRSAMHEEDTLRVQYVDVPTIDTLDARDIVNRLLRFSAQHLDDKNVLYTKEPETLVDAEGRERVPRLFPVDEANDRLNSVTRPIFHQTNLAEAVLKLEQDKSGGEAHLRELTRYETDERLVPIAFEADTIQLRITHATHLALKTPMGHRSLVFGIDEATGLRYLALASSLTSMVRIPMVACLAVQEKTMLQSGMNENTMLTLAAAEMVALAVVDPLFSGQKLAVHNASQVIATAVERQALAKGVDLIFLADEEQLHVPESWVKLPAYIGASDIAGVIPTETECFVGLSTRVSENESTLLSMLQSHCRIETGRTLFASTAREAAGSSATSLLGQLLKRAMDGIGASVKPAVVPSAVGLEAVISGQPPENPLTIVEWSSSRLPARVTRIESQRLFKGDKTYWLVGLSGALGISLCDWMIERGVKHLVLTSRNPKIDARWIGGHARAGVVIDIICCDVTDEKAIQAVHRQIVATHPPIVGLLNGAMVLRDVSVRNMEFDHVTDVIRPKVLGSIHLDRIFHDVDLDFFVLLSSINCVIGNVGQANYAAANMGMIGVAGNRRKRGLRSSVVNVGAIIGVGYITQSDRQLDVTVAKTAMMHLSEQDFHQIFAECMEAGHLDNPAGPEISTGLLDIVPESINIPPWYSDPKFARFIVTQSAHDSEAKEQSSSISTEERLGACATMQDAYGVVQEAFCAQLRRVLQVSVADEDLMRMRGVELGFDSLISVDIRSWFLKNFKVSIPVLKIMASDVQMSALVELTVEGIPADLIPLVIGENDTSSTEGRGNGTETPDSPSDTSISDWPTSPESEAYVKDDTAMMSVSTGIVVKWDEETCPPLAETFTKFPEGVKLAKAKPGVVVLTGCSGLLGHHLLNTLVAQPSIDKVICLATRRLAERVANNEIPAPSSRIVYLEGDLTAKRFGLSEADWLAVFTEADAVIHNGSDTSHLKYYADLRLANVESTKQLVGACIPRRIPLHYVSSAGVALFAGLDAFPEVSCTTTGKKPPADGSHGYMCGKWVCESMLERVHGLYPDQRIVMQRPSTIIREGNDAEVAKAGFDWVNALLHYCHKTRTVPRVDHNSGAFDLVSIETCCNDVLREVLRETDSDAASGAKEIVYVNNVGDIIIPMHRMAEMAKERGLPLYKAVPMAEWARIVVEAGMHPAVAALIEVFDEPGAEQYPTLLKAKALKVD